MSFWTWFKILQDHVFFHYEFNVVSPFILICAVFIKKLKIHVENFSFKIIGG